MLKVFFLFLCRFTAPGCVGVVVAGDACLSDDACLGAVGRANSQPFVDLSDAGAHFVQVVKRATHGNTAVGATAVQPSLNVTHGKVVEAGKLSTGRLAKHVSASATHRGMARSGAHHGAKANATRQPVSQITPFDCTTEKRPMQVIKGENGFSLKALNCLTGVYVPLYEVPYDRVPGGYAEMNACDINPFDNIVYCAMRADGECYAVRFDAERIEFVAILPPSIWSAGSFSMTGEYFVSMTGAELIVVPPLHEEPGYPDKDDARLKNYRMLKAEKPEGFMHTSDTVVMSFDMKGEGAGEGQYLISLYGPKLEIAKFEDGKCSKTWIKNVNPDRWDNIYGAGYNYGTKVFFSTNRGAGIYRIPLEDIDLDDEDQVVVLEQTGLSDASEYNDGVNCKVADDPYSDLTADTADTTEEPLPEFPVAPEVPESPATVAPEPAPVVAAPPPAPAQPDASQRLAWLLLMYAIPIMLCYACLIPWIPGRFNPFPWFWSPSMAAAPPPPPPPPPAPASPRPPKRSPFFSTLTRERPPPKPPASPVPPSSTATLRTVILEPEQPPAQSGRLVMSPPPSQKVVESFRMPAPPVAAAPAPTMVEYVSAPPVVAATAPMVETVMAPAQVITEVVPEVMVGPASVVQEVVVPEVFLPTAAVQQVREVVMPGSGMQAVTAITAPAGLTSPVTSGRTMASQRTYPGSPQMGNLQAAAYEVPSPTMASAFGQPRPVTPQ